MKIIKKITDDAAPEKQTSRKGKLALPWIATFIICFISLTSVGAWNEFVFNANNTQKIISQHKSIYAQTLSEIINKQLSDTQTQLNTLAKNELIIEAIIANNPTQTTSLSKLISNGFNNAENVQILSWDLSGTASFTEKNITTRNNIELMLLSQAGSNKPTTPEVFQHDKKWLVAFAAPVMKDNAVIGVILLTLNKEYLTKTLDIPSLKNTAKINFSLKTNETELITSIGDGGDPSPNLDLAFTDGQVNFLFNSDTLSTLKHSQSPIYIAIAIVLALMTIGFTIAYLLTTSFIKNDVVLLQNYIESQASLHKTKQPDLHTTPLLDLLNTIDAISQRIIKNSVKIEESPNYKSPQSNNKPSEKTAAAIVNEIYTFDHPDIFKEYDIRGLAEKQLTPENCFMIGKAIGTKARGNGIDTIVTGRDGRTSSERIQFDLSRGMISTGCNVINLGELASPLLYYSTVKLGIHSGVMVTGSHNPPEYNGFKIILDNHTLLGNEIQDLLGIIQSSKFIEGNGKVSKQDIREDYIQDICADIIIAKPMNIVIDAGNGMGGITSKLLTLLDCTVTELYCDVDGKFPNHGPDPLIESNLTDLIRKVKEIGADLGIAFDGDADRMVAVTSSGHIIPGDKLLMFFAKDIVSRNAASNILYDVKCSRNVEKIVSQFGGRSIMCRSGHSNMKAKMQESGALLGGEFTGHFYFKERWNGYDDGIYAALRLIELLSTSNNTLDEEVAALPQTTATNELHINIKDIEQGNTILRKLNDLLSKEPCKINTLDGIRAEFDKGWGLIRLSHTTNTLTLRFEGDTDTDMTAIKTVFTNALTALNLNLSISI